MTGPLTLALPFALVSAVVGLLEPSVEATVLLLTAATVIAGALALVQRLEPSARRLLPWEERRAALVAAIRQRVPFAACVDCMSLIAEGSGACATCGSRRGVTYVVRQSHAELLAAHLSEHLH